MKPLQGVFEHTEFRIKLFLPSSYYKQRPHAFNDRQIYHPNINIKTCEIVFPQIVKEWGAASEYKLILSKCFRPAASTEICDN